MIAQGIPVDAVAASHENQDLVPERGLIDLELGRLDTAACHEWIIHTAVRDAPTQCWRKNNTSKPPMGVVQYVVDNVSKNGYLPLNVGPKPSGEIPEESRNPLKGLGKWSTGNEAAMHCTPH